jgi:hypothetical protein
VRTHSQGRTERRKRESHLAGGIAIGIRQDVPIDFAADPSNRFDPGIAQPYDMGPAALTGAKSFLFRSFREGKENYLLPARLPRRTGRAAVNPRGSHGIDERAVRLPISGLNRLPP